MNNHLALLAALLTSVFGLYASNGLLITFLPGRVRLGLEPRLGRTVTVTLMRFAEKR